MSSKYYERSSFEFERIYMHFCSWQNFFISKEEMGSSGAFQFFFQSKMYFMSFSLKNYFKLCYKFIVHNFE